MKMCIISGFHCDVDDNCALLGSYATSGGNYLPILRDNLPAPSSGSRIQKVSNYHYSLLNNPQA